MLNIQLSLGNLTCHVRAIAVSGSLVVRVDVEPRIRRGSVQAFRSIYIPKFDIEERVILLEVSLISLFCHVLL